MIFDKEGLAPWPRRRFQDDSSAWHWHWQPARDGAGGCPRRRVMHRATKPPSAYRRVRIPSLDVCVPGSRAAVSWNGAHYTWNNTLRWAHAWSTVSTRKRGQHAQGGCSWSRVFLLRGRTSLMRLKQGSKGASLLNSLLTRLGCNALVSANGPDTRCLVIYGNLWRSLHRGGINGTI